MKRKQQDHSVESRLAQFGARIDDLLETVEHPSFVSGVKAELDVWHAWIDEARVQLALGTMEGHDRVSMGLRSIEHLYSRMLKRIEDLEGISDPVPGLSDALKHELEGAKEELSSPEAFAR